MTMQRDLHNEIVVRRLISPQAGAADNTAQVSQILDMQGFDGLEILIATGTIADADATFTVLLEHGEAANMSDAVAVPDSMLIGTEIQAAFRFDDDDNVRKLGYKASTGKRFVRLTITPAANTGAWGIGAVGVLFSAHRLATITQADT